MDECAYSNSYKTNINDFFSSISLSEQYNSGPCYNFFSFSMCLTIDNNILFLKTNTQVGLVMKGKYLRVSKKCISSPLSLDKNHSSMIVLAEARALTIKVTMRVIIHSTPKAIKMVITHINMDFIEAKFDVFVCEHAFHFDEV